MGKKREVDDRFKKFGTVSFTSITKVNDFVTHLEDGKVMGTGDTTFRNRTASSARRSRWGVGDGLFP